MSGRSMISGIKPLVRATDNRVLATTAIRDVFTGPTPLALLIRMTVLLSTWTGKAGLIIEFSARRGMTAKIWVGRLIRDPIRLAAKSAVEV